MDRHRQAEALWEAGAEHAAAGRHPEAWRCFEDAHDLVLDHPGLHLEAHHRLLPVNRALGRRDAIVDRLLIALAPLGIFSLITVYFRLRAAALRRPMYTD